MLRAGEREVSTHAFKLFGILELRCAYADGGLKDAVPFSSSLLAVGNKYGIVIAGDPRGTLCLLSFVCFCVIVCSLSL